MSYLLAKTIHILSSTVLFGTGIGSAYYMWRAHLTRNIPIIATTVKHVVFADWIFTTTSIIIQPLSGAWMAYHAGFSFTALWIWLSLGLYILAGVCWLPVVWIQIEIAKIAQECQKNQTELPERYERLMKIWFLLGIPAFIALMVIFWLMVNKPM